MEVIKFFQGFSSDFLNSFMIFITSFGSLYFLMFLACIIYWCYNKEIGYKLSIILSFSSVLNNIVKYLVQSERPIGNEGIFSMAKFSADGYSFPSGHVQNITTFGITSFVFIRNKVMFAINFIFIVLVSISRLYLGLHWPIDILGGIVLSLIVSIVLNEVLSRISNNNLNLFMGLVGLFFLLMIFFMRNDIMWQNFIKSVMLFFGIYIGYLFENRYVRFSPSASNLDNLIKVFIGFFTVILIDVLFRYVLIKFSIIFMFKYFIIGFWIFGIVPLIFKLCNLYYKEAYEITNVRYRK